MSKKKQKTHGTVKRFRLLKRTCTCSWWNIKLDDIKYKNQIIKIEKARTQYLSKPHKATIRPSPIVNNNPENQDVFIQNIPGNKNYAQATVPLNRERTSNNVIFWNNIVNVSTKLKYNINRALTYICCCL